MKGIIYASCFQKHVTDVHPQRVLCLKSAGSLCGHNKTEVTAERHVHRQPVREVVPDTVKLVRRYVTETDRQTDTRLFGKYLHGNTQNLNDSFNNCIWQRICRLFLQNGVMDRELFISVME